MNKLNKLKRIISYTVLLLSVYCVLPTDTFAQGPGFDDDVEDTPFDGGVTLIAAAAVGYGIKKMNDKRKGK